MPGPIQWDLNPLKPVRTGGIDARHGGPKWWNWTLNETKSTDIHYSTVSSLSIDDVEKIKSKFVQAIQDYVQTIGPSKEEALYNFNLDFYSLIRK
jgi:hypothetical protein